MTVIAIRPMQIRHTEINFMILLFTTTCFIYSKLIRAVAKSGDYSHQLQNFQAVGMLNNVVVGFQLFNYPAYHLPGGP